jgi:site-specific DNA recombinase
MKAIEDAAARLELPLVATFTDSGVSGAAGLSSRPALADAINFLRRGDVLITAKLDRLARDSFLAILIEREIERAGARLVSAAGEGATGENDASATFLRRILAAVAELERSLIQARTKSAMQAARSKGRRVGWIPYGKRLAPDGIHLEPDDAELAVLEEIRKLRVHGATLYGIAETLNERGIPTRHGRPWARSAVQQLLERHP